VLDLQHFNQTGNKRWLDYGVFGSVNIVINTTVHNATSSSLLESHDLTWIVKTEPAREKRVEDQPRRSWADMILYQSSVISICIESL